MSMVCPCKNCADRRVGCHGVCKQYNDWATQHREEARWARDSSYDIKASDFSGTSPRPGRHRKTRGTR